MRLFKKAAVCLLAAAMAVSMLTACGDDGPSNPGNGGNGGSTGGGNTSTSTPAKPDEGNSGNTSGGSEENGTTTLPTNWNASKTKTLFNKKGIADTNIYVDGTWSIVDAQTLKVKSSVEMVYAAKGRKLYMKMVDNSGTVRLYKNDAGDFFVQSGDTWYECTDSTDIQNAKLILAIQQIQYRVPTNVYDFKAYTQSGYYYERFASNWNGQKVVYTYGYSESGTLYGINMMVDSTTGYITCPVTLSANPSDDFFPNVVS